MQLWCLLQIWPSQSRLILAHNLLDESFLNLTLLLISSIMICCFPLILFYILQGGNTSGTTLLFIVFLFSMTLGTILMCFLRKEEDKAEKEPADASVNFYSYLVSLSKSIITLLADIRMLLIIPLIAYSGLQQAFVW